MKKYNETKFFCYIFFKGSLPIKPPSTIASIILTRSYLDLDKSQRLRDILDIVRVISLSPEIIKKISFKNKITNP